MVIVDFGKVVETLHRLMGSKSLSVVDLKRVVGLLDHLTGLQMVRDMDLKQDQHETRRLGFGPEEVV